MGAEDILAKIDAIIEEHRAVSDDAMRQRPATADDHRHEVTTARDSGSARRLQRRLAAPSRRLGVTIHYTEIPSQEEVAVRFGVSVGLTAHQAREVITAWRDYYRQSPLPFSRERVNEALLARANGKIWIPLPGLLPWQQEFYWRLRSAFEQTRDAAAAATASLRDYQFVLTPPQPDRPTTREEILAWHRRPQPWHTFRQPGRPPRTTGQPTTNIRRAPSISHPKRRPHR